MDKIIAILMMGLLICGSVEDYKTHMVHDKYTVSFCLLGILMGGINRDYLSAILSLICLFATIFVHESKYIGGADILIYGGMIGFLGSEQNTVLNIILYSNSIALFIFIAEKYFFKKQWLTRENRIAMLPSLGVSFLLLLK